MIRKGLKVKILAGKDKAKEGEVIEIDRSNNRAKVKDLNMIKKHVRKNQDQPQGEIVEREGTIHWSNVMQAERYEKKHKIVSAASESETSTEKEE